MTVGVVLGAGGPLGWAYHLGVVQGVRDAIGREPADADRLVGTSAGAAIAATLLTGVPASDVIEMISTPPSDDERDQMRSASERLRRNPVGALRPVAPGLARCVRQFQPKVIAGSRYVDGAVASSTHADILVPEAHDVVLISAPMARFERGVPSKQT